METFRSIDELIRMLSREKVLLKDMFQNRKKLSYRYDTARELVEYKESRIVFLIDHGVIHDGGDFLELADDYLRFFEAVLDVNEDIIRRLYNGFRANSAVSDEKKARYAEILRLIEGVPKYGNDLPEVDMFARQIGQTYTKPLLMHTNPRGGMFHAGLYPVSANVPLGYDTGASPDGRLANTPIADGVGPMAGRDTHGPTATANSVSRLDLGDASNGTLLNQKFHPSALAGEAGLEKFVAYLRGFFDRKGMHVQYNVVSRETLLDAQAHPENYKTLVVRVAGYSALFTTLSRSLQDDIINRTEQAGL